MKRIVLFFALCPLMGSAQTTLLSEDFDSYTAGAYAGVSSPAMNTWSLTPGGADDCLISSAQSSSPSNSIHIIGQSGPIDAMVIFPTTYNFGQFRFSMKFYVVAGKAAYFNCQESNTPGLGWKCDIFFANNGTGYVGGNGAQGPNFNYSQDTWLDVVVNADLTADQGTVSINGSVVHTFIWSTGVTGSETYNRWGGVNFYAYGPNDESAEYYVDDLLYEDLTDYTTISENEGIELSLYPNPTTGIFNLSWSGNEAFDVTVTDLSGKVVFSQLKMTSNSTIDADFAQGTYLVSLWNENNSVVKKIVVQ